MNSILLVEDDEVFGQLLKNYLEMSKFRVDWAKDGAKGYSQFNTNSYDLCILDVMMPHIDGFTLAQKIKNSDKRIPFLFLTARSQKEDIIKGYELGASDFLNKPFDVEILIHKLNVLLQSNSNVSKLHNYNFGIFSFNPQNRILTWNNSKKRLSPKESDLLRLLLENKNEVLERGDALNQIWKEDSYFTKRSMDVYVTKLRKYLAMDDSIQIETITNLGFSLKSNITSTQNS